MSNETKKEERKCKCGTGERIGAQGGCGICSPVIMGGEFKGPCKHGFYPGSGGSWCNCHQSRILPGAASGAGGVGGYLNTSLNLAKEKCCNECGRHDNFCVPSCFPTHCHFKGCSCHSPSKEVSGWEEGEHEAMNIVYQLGDLLYNTLPPKIAHKYFVKVRQETNDRAIEFAQKIIQSLLTSQKKEMVEKMEREYEKRKTSVKFNNFDSGEAISYEDFLAILSIITGK